MSKKLSSTITKLISEKDIKDMIEEILEDDERIKKELREIIIKETKNVLKSEKLRKIVSKNTESYIFNLIDNEEYDMISDTIENSGMYDMIYDEVEDALIKRFRIKR